MGFFARLFGRRRPAEPAETATVIPVDTVSQEYGHIPARRCACGGDGWVLRLVARRGIRPDIMTDVITARCTKCGRIQARTFVVDTKSAAYQQQLKDALREQEEGLEG